ncbi:DnaJ domain-containing protein [Demequina sp. TTPB684]|uniref:DnaJ C-terminal domain-containing protein n=1 Tax=unclassified Demequina TaxID=2620311 RepID=UPI001CF1F479|nr:DnaJ C-terminal domain-containing protein [Demequina sp. TMPB413]MCB2413638.1 DnaJ domain-containing protein [Demequina sp. TTPB684]UPU88239.1 DnaJ domain-containing protein [Demequina sp. TMPB413]
MTSQDWFNKDFYATLGVPKDASATDIKKAYRKLARDLHPDRHPNDASAEKRFKEVGEAYGVLSDAEQRQQYDAIRAMGGGARFQAGGPGGGQGFEDVFGGMFGGGPTRGQGFEDILGGLFGGRGRGPQRGADLAAATEVTFRQATQGATVTLGIDGQRVSTRLPVGVADGQKIRIRGKGRPGAGGGPAGDVILTVHVGKHPVFTADGRNLRMNLPVSFDEAVLGATVEVPTLTGERVKVKIAPGTSSGATLRVKGKGLVAKDGVGDLLVRVEVAVPSKLSKAAKEALQAFALETAADDPRARLYDDAAK